MGKVDLCRFWFECLSPSNPSLLLLAGQHHSIIHIHSSAVVFTLLPTDELTNGGGVALRVNECFIIIFSPSQPKYE